MCGTDMPCARLIVDLHHIVPVRSGGPRAVGNLPVRRCLKGARSMVTPLGPARQSRYALVLLLIAPRLTISCSCVKSANARGKTLF